MGPTLPVSPAQHGTWTEHLMLQALTQQLPPSTAGRETTPIWTCPQADVVTAQTGARTALWPRPFALAAGPARAATTLHSGLSRAAHPLNCLRARRGQEGRHSCYLLPETRVRVVL